jgi:hypothetical protein
MTFDLTKFHISGADEFSIEANQARLAKSRAKEAGKCRKFTGHIDRKTGQPHYPRNQAEAHSLMSLATFAQDETAMEFYGEEIAVGALS